MGDLISWASVSSSVETDLNQLFSTCNVRAHSISTTWELVRNADSWVQFQVTLELLNQKLWGKDPAKCVLISPASDSNARSTLRTTSLEDCTFNNA